MSLPYEPFCVKGHEILIAPAQHLILLKDYTDMETISREVFGKNLFGKKPLICPSPLGFVAADHLSDYIEAITVSRRRRHWNGIRDLSGVAPNQQTEAVKLTWRPNRMEKQALVSSRFCNRLKLDFIGEKEPNMSQEWTRDDLLILGRDFMIPRIFLTAAELDLFTKLKGNALSVDELCATEGWDRRGLTILMNALAAEGLLSRRY